MTKIFMALHSNSLIQIGMSGDTFISVSFLDQLNFYQRFSKILKVKMDINGFNLTPCQAHLL